MIAQAYRQRLFRSFGYDAGAALPSYDGLSAFAPMWAIASLFSIAGDPYTLAGDGSLTLSAVLWAQAAACVLLILKPQKTWLLVTIAALSVIAYLLRLPVASNNKTITTVMNLSILLTYAVMARQTAGDQPIDRPAMYDHLRVVARSLLAIMYFYGIFHKINTDFLDPQVSCAVSLYAPLASPFGLENNIYGRYLAIYSTFIVEAIAIVSLYWRRYFAVGLILALIFHFIIPISAYSWYMDFSSLVFALYFLTMPKQVSEKVYHGAITILRPVRGRVGRIGVLLPGALLVVMAIAICVLLASQLPSRSPVLVYHSAWVLIWAALGGCAMVAMSHAALQNLPYDGPGSSPQPRWLFIIPGVFFLSCLSPYVGLKTESSIAMFSNLHTEGGQTNHLLFDRPPYLFDYQKDIVQIVASSSPWLLGHALPDRGLTLFTVKEHLRQHPQHWATYRLNGAVHERMTAASFPHARAGTIERNLLLFKPVDFRRPKVCTH